MDPLSRRHVNKINFRVTCRPQRDPEQPSFLVSSSWKGTEVAAQRLGVALEVLELRGPEDFEAAFATAKQRSAQALLDLADLTAAYKSRISALAASSRLPAMYTYREYPDAGGLMSYGRASSTSTGVLPPSWTRS
jgi:putative ABC transport system substrate-binding protein